MLAYATPNFCVTLYAVKCLFFIDGFNLYHRIDESFSHGKYKWLDLRKLSEQFLEGGDEIGKIIYFTAYCTWNQNKKNRHKKYIQALSKKGVEICLGKFKKVTKRFDKEHMEILTSDINEEDVPDKFDFRSYEEKETDVNIAVNIIKYAVEGGYEHFYVMSADSDFVPAIKHVKKTYRNIKLTNILPINAEGTTLRQVFDDQLEMTEEYLNNSLLDNEIKISSKETIKKPKKYN